MHGVLSRGAHYRVTSGVCFYIPGYVYIPFADIGYVKVRLNNDKNVEKNNLSSSFIWAWETSFSRPKSVMVCIFSM